MRLLVDAPHRLAHQAERLGAAMSAAPLASMAANSAFTTASFRASSMPASHSPTTS